MTIKEIKDMRDNATAITDPKATKKPVKITVWENLQLLGLALTISGQIFVGGSYLTGQAVWLAANVLALVRDFILHRPAADKIKNAALTALTLSLIIMRLLGWY